MKMTNTLASTKSTPAIARVKLRPGRNANQRHDESHQSRWINRYEHYCGLAQQSGNADAVTREEYWQHAEYFRRLMNGSA